MAKKRTHPNKTPLHCLESCDFDKILADISGPFRCDSLGNKYCLMVIETLSIYVILILLKVSQQKRSLRRYTHMFSPNMECAIQYYSRIEGVHLEAAIAEIFKVKQVFGMTARPTTLAQ